MISSLYLLIGERVNLHMNVKCNYYYILQELDQKHWNTFHQALWIVWSSQVAPSGKRREAKCEKDDS